MDVSPVRIRPAGRSHHDATRKSARACWWCMATTSWSKAGARPASPSARWRCYLRQLHQSDCDAGAGRVVVTPHWPRLRSCCIGDCRSAATPCWPSPRASWPRVRHCVSEPGRDDRGASRSEPCGDRIALSDASPDAPGATQVEMPLVPKSRASTSSLPVLPSNTRWPLPAPKARSPRQRRDCFYVRASGQARSRGSGAQSHPPACKAAYLPALGRHRFYSYRDAGLLLTVRGHS